MSQRNSKRDAAVGAVSGLTAGMLSSLITHPLDTHIIRTQTQGKKLPYSMWKAPFHREMWHGAVGSAFKKGVNYGISMGATFGLASIIKNALDKKNNLTKLGFHKHYDRS